MYKALNIVSNPSREITASNVTAGVDTRGNPQFFSPSKALNLMNYIIMADGRTIKRKGRSDFSNVADQDKIYDLATLGEHDIVGYGTTIASYYRPTSTWTVLKDDFAVDGKFSVAKNGEYVYITKGGGIYQIKFKRSAELVSSAAWIIPGLTVNTGTIKEWYSPATLELEYITGNDGVELDISATVGDKYEFDISLNNYNEVSTYFNNAYVKGCFDQYRLAESQNHQNFIMTASSAGNLKLDYSINYPAVEGNYFVPTGTINGTNKVFDIGTENVDWIDVRVDGSTSTPGWSLSGRTLTVANAPVTSILVKIRRFGEMIGVPPAFSAINSLNTSISVKKIIDSELEINLFSNERCKIIRAINGRLYAANYPGDAARCKYSSTGINLDVPVASWSIGGLNNDAGEVRSLIGGGVVDIGSRGSTVDIFYEHAEVGTGITLGDTYKKDEIYYAKASAGLVGGLVDTPDGLIVPNSQGIYLKNIAAATNIPYSDSQELISDQLADFDDYDFSDAASIYYQPLNITMIACRRDSDVNNYILVYFHDYKAWGYFSGWNVTSFILKDGELYAGSAIDGIIYKLFDTNSDGENEIWTGVEQEVSCGSLHTSKRLLKEWFSGRLSLSTVIRVDFDIFDRNGILIPSKKVLFWNVNGATGNLSGIGSGKIGGTIGGAERDSGLINSFEGAAEEIPDFQRIRVRISEHSKIPHEISWFKIETVEKDEITKRGLSASSFPPSMAILTEDGEPLISEDNQTLVLN